MSTKRQHIIAELRENLMNIKRIMFSALPKAKPGKPTFAQVGVMFMLEEYTESSVKDISERFQISPSAITQLLNGLVSKKLIVRSVSGADARKTKLKLTDMGKKRLAEIKKENAKIFTKVFKPLSDTELQTLDSLQKKVIASMKKSLG